MACATAAQEGVEVELLETDLFGFEPDAPFDVVLDSGCMHNMGGAEVAAYRERVLQWLAPGGDFVLSHWGKRHALDWRPIGPRRRTRETVERTFAPELELLETATTDEQVPFPFGPRVRMASYWFRRGSA